MNPKFEYRIAHGRVITEMADFGRT